MALLAASGQRRTLAPARSQSDAREPSTQQCHREGLGRRGDRPARAGRVPRNVRRSVGWWRRRDIGDDAIDRPAVDERRQPIRQLRRKLGLGVRRRHNRKRTCTEKNSTKSIHDKLPEQGVCQFQDFLSCTATGLNAALSWPDVNTFDCNNRSQTIALQRVRTIVLCFVTMA